MIYSKIDKDGVYIEPVLFELEEGDELPNDLITDPIPEGFYRPKWDGKNWIEGLSIEEIETLKENNKPEPSEIEKLREENQMNAMAIMELAEIILNGGIE